MSTPTPIREAGPEGIDEAMAVMVAAFDPGFGEAWDRGQCLGVLGLGDVWLSLAGEKGQPRGFALVRRVLDEAELLLLAVTPTARRQGIGRALIERSAGEARRRGAARLLLEVRAGNAAQGLYAAAGFTAIGRRAGYYRGRDGTLHDALTLARTLG